MSFLKKVTSACADLVTARRTIWDTFDSCRTIRVAVIGGRDCGKTVFLSALANHLRHHRRSEFSLGGGTLQVHWNKGAITGNKLHGLPLFDYKAARWRLSHGQWPEKTVDTSILALRLLLEDTASKSREQVQLEVLDLPGERVADFAMMGRSYGEWCRWRAESLTGADGTSPHYRHYLDKVKALGADDEAAVLDAYRDFMAGEYGHFSPDITPSTVKLGIDGRRCEGTPGAFREAIGKVPLGFADADGKVYEFAPLPVECLEGDSPFRAMARKFARGYDMYVKRVVRPMEDWLGGAEKLFYLVDVLKLLRSGADAWDAEKQNAEAAIAALCPHSGNVLSRVWRWAKGVFWRTQINAVYVVATKSDLVVGSANRSNMRRLAGGLVDHALPFLDSGIKTLSLSCAAVCSTEEVRGEKAGEVGLRGLVEMSPNAQPELVSWIPPDVPAEVPTSPDVWRAKIEAGDFDYHGVFPAFSTASSFSPPHLGLDVLVNEMLAG